ncbi:hypothetical protein [Tepidiphilus baoligensis]|uniref:Uncharacterized protein n=1 Tax=Tepidiphilus baoligensis TaxID=2698687 RepID=A0ABX1QJG1_9PROT|nr:hypothetical protein [Tepidiphilus baoligensis]NMH16115.1 hypothetical protein [Tepidiphilus baoligensis]
MKDTSRLILTYTLEVSLPEPLQKMPRADLARVVDGLLGDVVHQGLKAVASKRLQGGGIMVHKLQHRVDVERPRREPGKMLPKELLVRAAPHLTDEELAEVEARVGNAPFLSEDELEKRIRTQALKVCNDVRLAPVVVRGVRPNDEPLETEAQLNFTHGSVFFDESQRNLRLKANAPVEVLLPGVDAAVQGRYLGTTLGGPVVEVPIHLLAPYRDFLLAAWQGGRG